MYRIITKPTLRYCLLLRIAATSCWITQEPLDEEGAGTPHGMGNSKTSVRIPRHREEETELPAEQNQNELRTCGLPFEKSYHLIFHFPFMLLKKKQHTTQNSSCWLKPRHFACLQTKVFICPPSQLHSTAVLSTQCFHLTVPFLTQRG